MVRSVSQEAHNLLRSMPFEFTNDKCSRAPDTLFGYYIGWACEIHDWRYCTRCHPAGSMTIAAKNFADKELKDNLRAYLPFFLRWIGWVYLFMTWRYGGYSAFDSCGADAQGNISMNPCRHGMYPPKWMLEQAAAGIDNSNG